MNFLMTLYSCEWALSSNKVKRWFLLWWATMSLCIMWASSSSRVKRCFWSWWHYQYQATTPTDYTNVRVESCDNSKAERWQVRLLLMIKHGKMYLSKLSNIFVQIAKCICWSCKIYFPHVWVESCDNSKAELGAGKAIANNQTLQNVFVQIAKRICPNFKMYLLI